MSDNTTCGGTTDETDGTETETESTGCGAATDGGTTHGRRADRDEPGIVIAALPYCCRVCGTETDLYVDAKEADDGYEVDGHTNRVQRIGCETCGQERVHVVAVKGIDEPHERPPIQSYREAADG